MALSLRLTQSSWGMHAAVGGFISGSGTNLQALIDAIQAGQLNAQITLVYPIARMPMAYCARSRQASKRSIFL